MSARNGAATKALPKTSSAQRTMAAMQKDIDGLREEVTEVKGLLTELLKELRVAAIKQVLATPEGQQAMAQLSDAGQPPVG